MAPPRSPRLRPSWWQSPSNSERGAPFSCRRPAGARPWRPSGRPCSWTRRSATQRPASGRTEGGKGE
eukprot:416001-Alexandrium_andersonii.AAC.1